MNFTNYDRLVQHLKTMPPQQFDYSDYLHFDSGCLYCQIVNVEGRHVRFRETEKCLETIRDFLGVDIDQAHYLFVQRDENDPSTVMTGQEGIANALHRLDLVASRYTRPTISTDLETTTAADREREFLVRCMAVAAEPVTETAE